MLRSVLCIGLILALFPSPAFSQTSLALKGGIGSIHSRVDRHRLLAGMEATTSVQKGRDISMDLKGAVEFSYKWWDDVQWDDESAWAILALVDLFPEVTISLNSVVQPFLGAGVTIGFERETVTMKGRAYDQHGNYLGIHESKNVARDFKYGLNVQPGLRVLMDRLFFKGVVKYRYALDDVRYKWSWDSQENMTGNEDFASQSIDLIFSVGGNLGTHLVEVGMQAENWVVKHEDRKEWPKWPEDWEYMLFGKIHFSP